MSVDSSIPFVMVIWNFFQYVKKVDLCTWHDYLYGNSKGICQKIPRTNKWVQQSFRMYNKHRKINCISISKNEYAETKIENRILFTVAPKKMRYLGIYLIKHVWDLYAEYYKMLMREAK